MGRVLIMGSASTVAAISSLLLNDGHHVVCVTDLSEAAKVLRLGPPDLFLLEADASEGDGLSFVHLLRNRLRWTALPVIVLSSRSDRESILRARTLKVQEYLLKSQLSPDLLVTRVRKYMQSTHPVMAANSERDGAPADRRIMPRPDAIAGPGRPSGARGIGREPAKPAMLAKPAILANSGVLTTEIPTRLTREQTLDRIRRYTESKTLAGAVAQVLGFANSARGNLADLVAVLKQDTVLATRVLHVANSAAFTSNKPSISTIEEAVRNIGLNAVRNVAMSVGVFENFPPDERDGFNTIRCWQHCFAVAALMDSMAPQDDVDEGVAHLVGLCHDLPEIVLRNCFAAEYAAVVEGAAASGKPLQQVEAAVLGVRRPELVRAVLQGLSLPKAIATPIQTYFAESRGQAVEFPPLVRALTLANCYAHGMLLAPAADAPIRPLTVAECRNVLGSDARSTVDTAQVRSEVLVTTAMLARLSRADEKRLTQPLVEESELRLWYARHPAFATWDPLEIALQLLCDVQTHDRLPECAEELEECQAILAISPQPETAGFNAAAVAQLSMLAGGRRPVALLLGSGRERAAGFPQDIALADVPLSLSQLGQLLAMLVAESNVTPASNAAFPHQTDEQAAAA